jgi:hypothetical protein
MSVIHWSSHELGAVIAYELTLADHGHEAEHYRKELSELAADYSRANTKAFVASYKAEADTEAYTAEEIAEASRAWGPMSPGLAKTARRCACLLYYNQIDQNGRNHATADEALAIASLVSDVLVGTMDELERKNGGR